MDELFPHSDSVDYTRLQMTPEGMYSLTKRRDSEKIVQFMSDAIGDLKHKTITDATACVGGDSIQFALSFQKVHSVELKHDNFIVLQNNIRAYGLDNVFLHKGDVTRIFKWKTDVLYVDPPWGGPRYRMLRLLDVFLSNIRLDIWIETILKADDRPKYIFLKLPYNYKFSRLQLLPNIESVRFYNLSRFVLVLLTTG